MAELTHDGWNQLFKAANYLFRTYYRNGKWADTNHANGFDFIRNIMRELEKPNTHAQGAGK